MTDGAGLPPPPPGPWGNRDGVIPPDKTKGLRAWLRAHFVGQAGLIQRTSRFLLKVALISGAAVIIPPLLGASTVLTLACLSFFSAGVLGYLSWLHDMIDGRKESAGAKRRRRALWLAAAIWMVGVLVMAMLVVPTTPPSPPFSQIVQDR